MVTDAPPNAPPRNYWQLPTFLLGLVAVYAAYKYVPARGTAAGPAAVGDYADLKAALERKPVDAAAVEPLLRKLAADPTADTPTNFALGSGYLALAELAPGDNDHWSAAAKAFEACDPAKLDAPADGSKLAFRRAMARAAIGTGDPGELIRTLIAPPTGEERGECARLIAQTALRLTPPDTKRAKEAMATYLGGPNRASPPAATRYKLELAKLYAKDREYAKAKSWLADVGPAAPADVAAMAKLELGQLAMADRNWPEAVANFKAAMEARDLPAEHRGLLRYQTGVALMQSGSDPEAAPFLRQALKEPGDLGAAAAMKLAEIAGRDPGKGTRKEAAAWLEKAVTQASANSEHVKPTELRAAFEEVIKASAAEGDYPAAHQAATAYAKVAEADADRKYRAEISEKWAADLAKTSPAEAKPKFLDAAAEYAALADRALDAEKKAELSRKAALQYRQAGETTKALELVSAVLNAKDVPAELVGRSWLDRADLLPADQSADIDDALRKAMALPGPAATQARYKLAVAYVKRGQDLLATAGGSTQPESVKRQAAVTTKLGRDMLAQIADASTVTEDERFAHEQALFEIGKQAMYDGRPEDAEARLRKLLTLYPKGDRADNARLWLASALLARGQKDAAAAPKAQAEALVYLKELAKSSDPFLQTWGEIWQANTLLQMGDATGTVRLCQELMPRHAGKLEELVLGKLQFRAYLAATPADPGAAQKTLTRMEELFAKLPADAFRMDPEYSQEHWKAELPRLREMLEKR